MVTFNKIIFTCVTFVTLTSAQSFANDAEFFSFGEKPIRAVRVVIPKNVQLLEDPRFYEITEVSIERIESVEANIQPNVYLSLENDCSKLKPSEDFEVSVDPDKKNKLKTANGTGTQSIEGATDLVEGIDLADVILDKIINMGSKIWNLVKKSRPIVNTKTAYANALPYGIKCWDQLELWQAPRSDVFRTVYKNLFGFEVIRFDVRVMHSFGGRFNGKGRYITNAAVQYRDLRVAPGMFELNADVQIQNVLNVGTKENPVAAMQMTLNWTAKGVNHTQNTANFVVYGDGRPTDVHN